MPPTAPYTTGSPSFHPDDLFAEPSSTTSKLTIALTHLTNGSDLRSAMLTAFSLPSTDNYTYHAIASVTLSQVQSAISAGRANNLHAWYLTASSPPTPIDPPPLADIDAYIALFNPKSTFANALKGFGANARKSSLRASVADHLLAKRHLDPKFAIPKRKKPPPPNPYFDFWAWACRELEWAGPTEGTERVRSAHHVLPVFMHHFGCVVPSYEALEVLRLVAGGRRVLDVGSGNGYWTEMLRRNGMQVTPVDSGQSEYRTVWVPDTVRVDGVEWLRKRGGGKEEVLLCVYPVTEGGFTPRLLREYKGSAICIAGTQNGNGYTGFKGEGVEDWIARELKGWVKTVQIPLPSFPGKDEALFVFEKPDT